LNIKNSTPIENPITKNRLNKLKKIAGEGPVLILTHDNPDPDSLASGKALYSLLNTKWGILSDLLYCGIIARAENQAMLQILAPEWRHQEVISNYPDYTAIALVDTQPGAGNNSLPEDIIPHIVIDHHHPIRESVDDVPYIDMRPDVGATVSLLYQHLEAARITPEPDLATAMFYGIQTDTQGLSRGSSPLDQKVYFELLSLLDRDKLIQVERAGLSRDYFRAFSKGLLAAQIYDNVIIADLQQIHRPDFVAEIADLLIRLKDTKVALCLGYHQQTLYFSLRSKPSDIDAGTIVQKIIFPPGKAGGHGSMAGGQIKINGLSYKTASNHIVKRFLEKMNEDGDGQPLLN